MTIREGIQRVSSLYSKGVGASAARLSRRHIWNKLITVRERVLTQQINKNQKISQWCYQTVPCVDMIDVPVVECPCVPPLGMYILRSKYKLPAVMASMDKQLFQAVMSMDGSVKYDESEWSSKKYKKGAKYTSTKIDYFIHGEYLWLTATKKPEKLTLSVLGADPIKWYQFGYCCDDQKCTDFLSLEFPVEGSMFESIVELAALELIEGFARRKEDVQSNSRDDVQ
jgi:hypothetical protein